MKWLISIIVFLLCSFLFCEISHAQTILDPDRSSHWDSGGGAPCTIDNDSQLEASTDSSNSALLNSVDDTTYMSFQNSLDFSATGIGLEICRTSTGDSMVVALYTNNGSERGTQIAGAIDTVDCDDLALNVPTDNFFQFPSTVTGLSGSTTYWIGVNLISANNNTIRIAYNTSDTYANGNLAYVDNGGSFTNMSNWDIWFYLMGCD
jgi:hypothetical protein